MPVLMLSSAKIAEIAEIDLYETCDFDNLSLEERIAGFTKRHKLDIDRMGEWPDYSLREWFTSTKHVMSWAYFTRFTRTETDGRILALKVGCRVARRALVFWENEPKNERRGCGEPKEVIEYVEELIGQYERGKATSKIARSLRGTVYNLAKYIGNDLAFPMSLPSVSRQGAEVIERLGIAAGDDMDENSTYPLAENIMAALDSATEIHKPEWVRSGLVYSQPKSTKSDRYASAERTRQRADFIAVLDELEGGGS